MYNCKLYNTSDYQLVTDKYIESLSIFISISIYIVEKHEWSIAVAIVYLLDGHIQLSAI